jgi:hypothetical protein
VCAGQLSGKPCVLDPTARQPHFVAFQSSLPQAHTPEGCRGSDASESSGDNRLDADAAPLVTGEALGKASAPAQQLPSAPAGRFLNRASLPHPYPGRLDGVAAFCSQARRRGSLVLDLQGLQNRGPIFEVAVAGSCHSMGKNITTHNRGALHEAGGTLSFTDTLVPWLGSHASPRYSVVVWTHTMEHWNAAHGGADAQSSIIMQETESCNFVALQPSSIGISIAAGKYVIITLMLLGCLQHGGLPDLTERHGTGTL